MRQRRNDASLEAVDDICLDAEAARHRISGQPEGEPHVAENIAELLVPAGRRLANGTDAQA
jgi:hypothetical protein